MGRLTTNKLLAAVAAALTARTGNAWGVRYFSSGDATEVGGAARFSVEPGRTSALRRNVASPGIEQRVRLVVEETPVFAALAETIARRRDELENLARDLSKEPGFVDGAFLTGWETFADAPGGYVVDAAQDDVATFAGGLELVFAIE